MVLKPTFGRTWLYRLPISIIGGLYFKGTCEIIWCIYWHLFASFIGGNLIWLCSCPVEIPLCLTRWCFTFEAAANGRTNVITLPLEVMTSWDLHSVLPVLQKQRWCCSSAVSINYPWWCRVHSLIQMCKIRQPGWPGVPLCSISIR